MAKKEKIEKKPPKELTAKDRATLALRPSINAAAIVLDYTKPTFGEQDFNELVTALVDDIENVQNGNMNRCEGMLLGQAEALQSIFVNLSRRGLTQEYTKNFEAFMRLALKAQNQCRMTLETLSTIKNPPVIYAKQANIANGPQQVNNGVTATRAEEITNRPNELLEVQYGGETLDSRSTSAAIGQNQAMATVG